MPNWFTEGSDTIDPKDAKALLDELDVPISPAIKVGIWLTSPKQSRGNNFPLAHKMLIRPIPRFWG
jgi:hypothetical protein